MKNPASSGDRDLKAAVRGGLGYLCSVWLHGLAKLLADSAEGRELVPTEVDISLAQILQRVVKPVSLVLFGRVRDAALENVAHEFITDLVKETEVAVFTVGGRWCHGAVLLNTHM